MKKNTKKYVRLSIILYVVILSAALIGTLAWFVFEQNAEISTGENSKITAGEYLEIRDKNNGEWTSELKFNSDIQYPDVSVTPTGDVWYPKSLNEDDTLTSNPDDIEKVNGKNGYFVKLELEVRATQGLSVYLHDDSYVSGVYYMGEDVAQDALHRDAIAGAARVGFFGKKDDDLELKTVWVPNEKYELSFKEETDVKQPAEGEEGEPITETKIVPMFNTSGTPDEKYEYIYVDGDQVKSGEWADNQLSIGKDELAGGTPQDGLLIRNSTPLLKFENANEVKDLIVYVWVEGTDNESHTVLSGGTIKYSLKLVGIPEKAEAKELKEGDIVYDATEGQKLMYYSQQKEVGDEIEYSYDGIEWTYYGHKDENDNSDLVKGDTEVIYVRFRETATTKVGESKPIYLNVQS